MTGFFAGLFEMLVCISKMLTYDKA